MPEIFAALGKTTPGHGGEIQLTDALQALADQRGMYAYEFEGNGMMPETRWAISRPLLISPWIIRPLVNLYETILHPFVTPKIAFDNHKISR